VRPHAWYRGVGVVAAWLAGIVTNRLSYSGYHDIALRDFALMLTALTLGRLASQYNPPGFQNLKSLLHS